MDPTCFCYWLQGYFEIGQPLHIDELKLRIIKEHLDSVFEKFPRPIDEVVD